MAGYVETDIAYQNFVTVFKDVYLFAMQIVLIEFGKTNGKRIRRGKVLLQYCYIF